MGFLNGLCVFFALVRPSLRSLRLCGGPALNKIGQSAAIPLPREATIFFLPFSLLSGLCVFSAPIAKRPCILLIFGFLGVRSTVQRLREKRE